MRGNDEENISACRDDKTAGCSLVHEGGVSEDGAEYISVFLVLVAVSSHHWDYEEDEEVVCPVNSSSLHPVTDSDDIASDYEDDDGN